MRFERPLMGYNPFIDEPPDEFPLEAATVTQNAQEEEPELEEEEEELRDPRETNAVTHEGHTHAAYQRGLLQARNEEWARKSHICLERQQVLSPTLPLILTHLLFIPNNPP